MITPQPCAHTHHNPHSQSSQAQPATRPSTLLVCLLLCAALLLGACERRPAQEPQAQPLQTQTQELVKSPTDKAAPSPKRVAQPVPTGQDAPPPNNAGAPAGVAARVPPISFAPLVEKANPSVVNIYTKIVVRERVRTLDPFFPFAPRKRLSESLGTGFIIDTNGLILTNHHVIEKAAQIKVRTVDGREFNASVVGTDPPTDLAVIKIDDAPSMVPMPMGDSDKARVGDWVVAIGNALGLSSTVTVGIISGKGRSQLPVGGKLRYMDFIQTDASINPGNSGGPLLNLSGEVIGINTLINREGQGIGFAIPINMARSIIEPLIKDGRVSRAWLGIYVREVTEPIATQAGLATPTGVQIKRIIEGGPAQKAGLEVGDIILTFDGKPIANSNDLRFRSSLAGIGREVPLTVRRGIKDFQTKMLMDRSPHD